MISTKNNVLSLGVLPPPDLWKAFFFFFPSLLLFTNWLVIHPLHSEMCPSPVIVEDSVVLGTFSLASSPLGNATFAGPGYTFCLGGMEIKASALITQPSVRHCPGQAM